jgi:hypothetical protein
MVILLAILVVAALTGFTALGIWSRRSERDIDYTPTHEVDERLRNTTRAANTATIGFITGSQ